MAEVFCKRYTRDETPSEIVEQARQQVLDLLARAIENKDPFYFGVVHVDTNGEFSSVKGGLGPSSTKTLILDLLQEVIPERLRSVSDDEAS